MVCHKTAELYFAICCFLFRTLQLPQSRGQMSTIPPTSRFYSCLACSLSQLCVALLASKYGQASEIMFKPLPINISHRGTYEDLLSVTVGVICALIGYSVGTKGQSSLLGVSWFPPAEICFPIAMFIDQFKEDRLQIIVGGCFRMFTDLDFPACTVRKITKGKNLANIQPSWPNAHD